MAWDHGTGYVGLMLGLLCFMFLGCGKAEPERPAATNTSLAMEVAEIPETESVAATMPSIEVAVKFVEVDQQLQFEHTFVTDARGEQLAVETLGGGCGWIDYDCDGRWDIVCNQGGQSYSRDRLQSAADELYRQLPQRLEPVAQQARFDDRAFSQAVAIGDFNEDGFQDIYISNVFNNSLWLNAGDGTFIEMARVAGVDDPRWSSSAAWADLNADGLLDLYVCNYLQYDPTQPQDCRDPQGRRALCNPASLAPWPNACFINRGDGTFVDESEQRGLASVPGRSLGVAVVDLNGDQHPDIYIANDTDDNCLFLNHGDGNFAENAVLMGCATDYLGVPQGSMGIAVNDFDHNGFQDLYVTHYTKESNTLYENLGSNGFQDSTNLLGLHGPTLPFLGFGTVMQDFAHQGAMQLFVANGHVVRAEHEAEARMPAQLFQYVPAKASAASATERTRSKALAASATERDPSKAAAASRRGAWKEISEQAGSYFRQSFLGRGVAAGDLEGDGDIDLVVLNLDDRASLLRNDSERGNWISFSFIGHASNRFGIGVHVAVEQAGTRQQQQLCGGTSFAATHQPILSFGLGKHSQPVQVTLRWPGGIRQSLSSVEINQHHRIVEPRHEQEREKE